VTRKRGTPAPSPAAESRARDPRRELAEVDQVFKALAHASRRHVLLVLHYRGGEMTAGEIASRFACTWPTTTRHLRVLEDAGLVQVVQRGRERIYTVDRERLERIAGRWLALLLPAAAAPSP
jgi:DNA-binding transcriptional ArsR family regulator